MNIELNIDELKKFDEEVFSPFYKDKFPERPGDDTYPFWAMDRYHVYYRLFGYLSTLFNDSTFVELGTRRGHAAASLAFNSSNTVHTYDNQTFDIEAHNGSTVFDKMKNINYHVLPSINTTTPLGNILDKPEHVEIILNSDLIFVDVDPHSGEHEQQFFDFLIDNDYKGITLWDDVKVHLNEWFDSVQPHGSWKFYRLLPPYTWDDGNTGVICHGDQEFIFN